MKLLQIKDVHFVAIPKNGSSTLSDLSAKDQGITTNNGRPVPAPLMASDFDSVGDKNVHAFIREPVDRFRSAMVWFTRRIGLGVDEVLDYLEGDRQEPLTNLNRFTKQVELIGEDVHLHRFDDFQSVLESLLPDKQIEQLNSTNSKPDLTPEQLARVEAYYAEDIALYNSVVDGQKYVKPLSDVDKADKLAEISKARWQAEVAGITVDLGGVEASVSSDKETQAELSKALTILQLDPEFTINWRFPDGAIRELDGAAIQFMAQSVFDHVQATRTRFKELNDLIEAATTSEELNNIIW